MEFILFILIFSVNTGLIIFFLVHLIENFIRKQIKQHRYTKRIKKRNAEIRYKQMLKELEEQNVLPSQIVRTNLDALDVLRNAAEQTPWDFPREPYQYNDRDFTARNHYLEEGTIVKLYAYKETWKVIRNNDPYEFREIYLLINNKGNYTKAHRSDIELIYPKSKILSALLESVKWKIFLMR